VSNTRVLTAEFEYHRPARLEQALEMLARLPEARVLAGGTDLVNRLKVGGLRPSALVHVLDIPELGRLELDRGLLIGAAVLLYRIEEDSRLAERYTALHEAVRSLASVQIRTMATLAGNLCNASPGADTAGPLLALGAEAEIAGLEGGRVTRRRVSLEEFFTGPGLTVLKPGELLVAVHVPEPPPASGSAFLKLGRVTLDITKISASAYVERQGKAIKIVRLAVGAAAPRPVRAYAVEEALTGKAFSRRALEESVRRVTECIAPITDVRSTAEYRRDMAVVISRDAVLAAWRRAGGEVEE
jgi:CO/xanthine dehydrogenase FAD-binding subunit